MVVDPSRAMLDRLRAIEWADVDAMFVHARSRAALMREYLRRMALWAAAHDVVDAWPFLDPALRLDPKLRVDPGVEAELDAYIRDNIGRPSIEKTCRGAVHWAALRARGDADLSGLPDPFEPLLLMYERGGGFVVESEFIDLTGAMILFKSHADHASSNPLENLDPDALDAIDNVAR
ncbi:hypothetical protein [Streptomyces albus]|uniref:hypothetical protein n=1 Tax=Streptomyces albus TaxID=1888 RepID=UPI00099C8F75|nr:hypothetical protein [Streptomyces albus]